MPRPLFACLLLTAPLSAFALQEYKSGVEWSEPAMVTPGERPGEPPSDAVVLFGGTDLSAFKGGEKWDVTHGVATVGGGTISSKRAFGDAQYHLEFRTPAEVKGNGQGRGNSGLYIMGKYEVQILDSWENPTYFDGQAAGLYKQFPPLVNASREAGRMADVRRAVRGPAVRRARFARPPRLRHRAAQRRRRAGPPGTPRRHQLDRRAGLRGPHPEKLPFNLQDHGNPMSFRNIWVRELDLKRTPKYPTGWDGVKGEG